MNLFEKMFGTHSERELKLIYPIIDKIEKLRPEMMSFSDERLKDQTRIFKERLAAGETLDDILPEAFATVREAARRTLNMEHYPVPVSYTHLDVYKRQQLLRRRGLHRRDGADVPAGSRAGGGEAGPQDPGEHPQPGGEGQAAAVGQPGDGDVLRCV